MKVGQGPGVYELDSEIINRTPLQGKRGKGVSIQVQELSVRTRRAKKRKHPMRINQTTAHAPNGKLDSQYPYHIANRSLLWVLVLEQVSREYVSTIISYDIKYLREGERTHWLK